MRKTTPTTNNVKSFNLSQIHKSEILDKIQEIRKTGEIIAFEMEKKNFRKKHELDDHR
jgi:hypothetical protein